MATTIALDADEDGEAVDQKKYRSMIGSLLYLTATRPDIHFAVCLCARFQASPRISHWQAVKRIMRYLHFTPEFGLWYSFSSTLSLCGYSDADFVGYRLDQKSTSGTCQFLGSSLVSWSSRKQSSVAQSTTEAEYVAAASCCSQLLWMTYTLCDFGLTFSRVPLLCDSTSAISVAKNPVLHSKTKHIDVRYHFLRDHQEKGDIELCHVATQNQIADIFTKPLDQATFACLRGELCVCFPFWVGFSDLWNMLYTSFMIFGFCTLDLWFWSFSLVCILLVIFFSCIAFVYHALASYWASHICHEYSSILMWTDALDCGVCAMHCLYSWRNEIKNLWAKPLNWIWIVNAYHPWVAFC